MIKWILAWYAEYKLQKIRAKNEAIQAPYLMMKEVLERFAVMQSEQTKVLQTWMNSFQIHDAPSTTVVTDDDSFTAEQNAEYEKLMGMGKMTPNAAQSIKNAIGANAFPDFRDLFNPPEETN